MVFNFEQVALIISLIWLIILSVLHFRMYFHYNNLTKGENKKSLNAVLEELLKGVNLFKKDIDNLKLQCDKIEKDQITCIQKIGLLRFNPFKDTGGDQSFILALIDANNSGIVISGLYSRAGTRWYAKRVIKGQGVEHELSDEEKQAIKEAKKYG